MKSILKKLVMLVSVIATSQAAIATDFYVDGFGYDIISAADLTCRLTDGSNATGDITIPEKVTYKGKELTVTSIGYKVYEGDILFSGCKSLTSVVLPTSITLIGERAFYGCSNLKSISIPNSVTYIGDSAFYGCQNLDSITIPNSVTDIGDYAFYGCQKLDSITIPNSVTGIGDFAFSYCSSLSSVVIPNSVTIIPDGLFKGCENLQSVVIPNSVTYIAQQAFLGCTNIHSVVIPNSVNCIKENAFEVEDITIADGGEEMFLYSYINTIHASVSVYRPFKNMTQIYIGRNITIKEPYDFRSEYEIMSPFTDKLERLTIGGNVTSLSADFSWNNAYYIEYIDSHHYNKKKYPCKLKYSEIQKGEGTLHLGFNIASTEELEVVVNRTTKGYIRPDILKFGDDVEDISPLTISTERLKSVTFGKSISEITKDCLDGDKITTIYMRNPQPPTYEGSILQTTYTDATLYVPKGALEAYQTAEPWKTFWDIQEIDMDSGLDDITLNTNKAKPDVCVDGNLIRILNAEDMSVSVYNPDGSQIWQTDSYTGDAIELHPGMHIVRVGNRAIKLAI